MNFDFSFPSIILYYIFTLRKKSMKRESFALKHKSRSLVKAVDVFPRKRRSLQQKSLKRKLMVCKE